MTSKPSDSSRNGNRKREHLFKVLVIGELATGKTAIVQRYVKDFFSKHYRTTIGVDFALKIIKYDEDTIIRLQLWDIGGQERFQNMTRVYYKEAVGCIIVFDVTRPSTFDGVIKWKTDLDNKVELPDGNPVPCILLANKCDSAKDDLFKNAKQMDEFCREKGFIKWFETSAKENINIDTSIRYLIDEMMKNTKEPEPDPDIVPIDPHDPPKPPTKSGCCG